MSRAPTMTAARLLAAIALAACSARAPLEASADAGWPGYGADPGGTRYSPLTQISPGSAGRLQVAWTFRTDELGKGVADWARSAFEATPILYDGTLYFTTPST